MLLCLRTQYHLVSHIARFLWNPKFVSFEVLTLVLMKFLVHVDWYILYKTEIFNQNICYCVHICPPLKHFWAT
jgi:hypothetical protein